MFFKCWDRLNNVVLICIKIKKRKSANQLNKDMKMRITGQFMIRISYKFLNLEVVKSTLVLWMINLIWA